ncbi:MAG: MBL fold metallo-hydrolase [Bacteroidales bacterium]
MNHFPDQTQLFTDSFEFCSLGSGSSGNSYYIGNGNKGFLIDAGINGQHLKRTLQGIGIQIENIQAVFITHDHIDHVRALNALTRLYRIPVYANEGTWRGILNNRFTGNIDYACHEQLSSNQTISIAGFLVRTFPVSHDASDPVGYQIVKDNKSLVIATDLGFIGSEIADFLRKSSAWILESNYDYEMLINGRYSKELKNRILSETGHMDNVHTARFIAENYSENLSHILLCHLSKENNTPELALNEVEKAFQERNISMAKSTRLLALPRTRHSEVFTL